MGTSRLSLAGTLSVALVGAVAIGSVAQSDDTEMPVPNGVVITIMPLAGGPPMDWEQVPDAAYEVKQFPVTLSFDATDPRLSGGAKFTRRWHHYPTVFAVGADTLTVTNADGRWTGTGRSIGSDGFGDHSWWVLTGEDAYDGLTAYLSGGFTPEDTISGVIIADDLPPFPEPAE